MGFVTTIMIAFGERRPVSSATFFTMSPFAASRSSRLMPGFRARPAVITMISEPAVSSYPFVPVTFESYPSTGPASRRSSPLPCGTPSTTSTITTSASRVSAIRCTRVAPTWPAPTTVTFFRKLHLQNGIRLRAKSAG